MQYIKGYSAVTVHAWTSRSSARAWCGLWGIVEF